MKRMRSWLVERCKFYVSSATAGSPKHVREKRRSNELQSHIVSSERCLGKRLSSAQRRCQSPRLLFQNLRRRPISIATKGRRKATTSGATHGEAMPSCCVDVLFASVVCMAGQHGGSQRSLFLCMAAESEPSPSRSTR